jgi:quercetin dioxygenase-like cupin family protein
MSKRIRFGLVFVICFLSLIALAQERTVVTPQLLLSEIVQGMPKGERQEVRVLIASFRPGDQTMFHTHRFPVTVYVLEGAFTLEMEGREAVTVKADRAIVMPPQVRMTGYNRSSTKQLRLVIFSVSDPDNPFLDPTH